MAKYMKLRKNKLISNGPITPIKRKTTDDVIHKLAKKYKKARQVAVICGILNVIAMAYIIWSYYNVN